MNYKEEKVFSFYYSYTMNQDLENIQKIINLNWDMISDGLVIDIIDIYILYRKQWKTSEESIDSIMKKYEIVKPFISKH